MKSNRFWIVIVAVIFVVSCALTLLISIIPSGGGTAKIYRDGELVQAIDLTIAGEPYTITMEHDGEVNIIEVSDGRIRIADASCPDGTCMRQGWISTGAWPIVCLPHGIVIRITDGPSDGADAVAGKGGRH